MKYRVTFKDPDGPYDCATEAAKDSVVEILNLSQDEREQLVDNRANQLREFQSKFFRYGEYVTLELDTEENTCVVIPNQT